MPPRAVAPLSNISRTSGKILIRHPGSPNVSFSLVELSEQGSLHHQELIYTTEASIMGPERGYLEDRFAFRWSDDVQDLESRETDLKPDLGNLAEKDVARLDLSGLYEGQFVHSLVTVTRLVG